MKPKLTFSYRTNQWKCCADGITEFGTTARKAFIYWRVKNNILIDKERWIQKFKGSTRPQPTTIYTGTALLGIAQIPKSNAVPVFNAQQAKDTVKVK